MAQSTVDLIEAEIPRLRRYARHLTRDPDFADDIVQECLVRALDRIDSWRPGTNLRAWLFTILRNGFLDEVRRVQRNPLLEETAVDDQLPSVHGDPEARFAFREVREAFLALRADHREILLLVAIEGFRYEEAADVLGVPVGTVRSRLSRARQALRDALVTRSEIRPQARFAFC